jgi:MoxR-like ATPase
VTNATQLEQLIASIEQIEVVHSINDYIVRLANGTRGHPDLRLGVSTRGTLSLMRVAKAYAASEQRGYVTPDDIKSMAIPVLEHRLILRPEFEIEGLGIREVIEAILQGVAVPR